MRKLKLYHRSCLVGTVEAPDSFRPPISQAELDAIPSAMIARSRSWLFDVRPGDLRLQLRGEGAAEEVVIEATARLGSGDIGCLVGFEAAPGCEAFAPDEDMIGLADEVAGRVRTAQS